MAKLNNLAYDYSQYEVALQREPRERIKHQHNSNANTTSASKLFFIAIVAALLLCAILYGKVEMSKKYNEQNNLRIELNTINNDNTRLQALLETKTSIESVEDYAENVLGLKKLDNSQIEYVDLANNGVIEVVKKEDDNVFVSAKNWFQNVLEYIGV